MNSDGSNNNSVRCGTQNISYRILLLRKRFCLWYYLNIGFLLFNIQTNFRNLFRYYKLI